MGNIIQWEMTRFCGVPRDSYLQRDEREEGLCTGNEQHKTGHRVNVLKKHKVLLYIYNCSKERWKNYVKSMESGGIYIYPDVFHAKLTQHLGAYIS